MLLQLHLYLSWFDILELLLIVMKRLMIASELQPLSHEFLNWSKISHFSFWMLSLLLIPISLWKVERLLDYDNFLSFYSHKLKLFHPKKKWIRTEMKLIFSLLCWHIKKSVSITMERLKLCAYQNTAIVSEWEGRMRMRDQYQSINAIHQCCFKSLLFCLCLLNSTEWLVTK